jgi:hypothetical protein
MKDDMDSGIFAAGLAVLVIALIIAAFASYYGHTIPGTATDFTKGGVVGILITSGIFVLIGLVLSITFGVKLFLVRRKEIK